MRVSMRSQGTGRMRRFSIVSIISRLSPAKTRALVKRRSTATPRSPARLKSSICPKARSPATSSSQNTFMPHPAYSSSGSVGTRTASSTSCTAASPRPPWPKAVRRMSRCASTGTAMRFTSSGVT